MMLKERVSWQWVGNSFVVVPKHGDHQGHFSPVHLLLQHTFLVPTLCLVLSRCSISNYWKQGGGRGKRGGRNGAQERERGREGNA